MLEQIVRTILLSDDRDSHALLPQNGLCSNHGGISVSAAGAAQAVLSSRVSAGDALPPGFFGAALAIADETAFSTAPSVTPRFTAFLTAFSWLAMNGATIKEIQEAAGRKSITMSARYAHLTPKHKASVVDRIANVHSRIEPAPEDFEEVKVS
jgi:hypothetical protein